MGGVIYFLNIEAAKRFGQNLSGSNSSEQYNNEAKFHGSRQKRSIMSQTDENLSEDLLTESLNHHKLRNVAKKVAKLNRKEDQITKEILRQFCPKIKKSKIVDNTGMLASTSQKESV